MQLLAKSDSGITEVTIINYHLEYCVSSCFVSFSVLLGCYKGLCPRIHFVVLLIYRISLR